MADELVPLSGRPLAAVGANSHNPPTLFLRSESGSRRFWEFFTANIRNKNTRQAYFIAVSRFSAWCEKRKLALETIEPIDVAAYIEELMAAHAKPTVKQHLAAIRMLFDWHVIGQVIPINPAHSVRGPKHSVKKGKTSVLTAEEMRTLLDSIDTAKLIGLRDRAVIALMGYTFARVGAVIQLKVEDYYIQNRRGWVRLHEKGGKVNELPCHHNLEQFLDEWLSKTGLAGEPSAPLFPTMRHGSLTDRHALAQAEILPDDPAPRGSCGHCDENLLPQLPSDRDHGLFAERRQA
jgi:integrase/recombinase XerD